jgi:hypothetical protein
LSAFSCSTTSASRHLQLSHSLFHPACSLGLPPLELPWPKSTPLQRHPAELQALPLAPLWGQDPGSSGTQRRS